MATQETKEKRHSSFGERVKGAAHVFHGIGEDIRGSVMSAVESVSGSEEAKTKDEDIVTKGRSEIEQGIAQMKGVAVPGSTTAAAVPESQVEGKAGDQPQQEPAKQEASGPTPAPLPPPPGPTEGPVRKDDTQSRPEPEVSRQEPTGQTGTENVQQGSQETQAVPETKSPGTGDKGLAGEGADAP